MHAVVVRVTINDHEAATQNLNDSVVPNVSQAPGFKNGHWMRKDNSGMGVIVCESEDAARGLVEQLRSNPPPPDAVTLEDVEIREVVASA